jgi:RNA polymerase sigma-70 factor (ECF subfamily)
METTSGFSEKAIADLALIEEAKKGNEKAFESLMNRYRDSIYFMLLKTTNTPSDAEDLTNETFSKAFRNIDTYTPKFAFSTWLFKIATNNCVDFIRKNQTLPTPCNAPNDNQDNAVVTLLSDLPDPEELLINRQRTEVLENAINHLKPSHRELIQLRYYKEYSYEEMSAELKMPIGTIKAELHRAKTVLHKLLTKTNNR